MTIELVLEKKVMIVLCAYGPQVVRSDCEQDQFYDNVASERDLQNPGKMILGLENFIGHAARRIGDLHVGYEIGEKNVKGRRLLELGDEKAMSVANKWF